MIQPRGLSESKTQSSTAGKELREVNGRWRNTPTELQEEHGEYHTRWNIPPEHL